MELVNRFITLCAVVALSGLSIPAGAADFGGSNDVKQVRQVVAAKFGRVLHVSIAHDWALATASQKENDLSVVLHRASSGWTVVGSDGGAYDAETLKELGVPAVDTDRSCRPISNRPPSARRVRVLLVAPADQRAEEPSLVRRRGSFAPSSREMIVPL